VMEALTNVERHAHARLCRIRISVDERVNIEVVDDGVGLPAYHHPGVGIASMRERVAELGGSCTIESTAEGGTRVLASLPASSRAPGWDDQSVDATTTFSLDPPS
jgi:two-component system NarL family sensor kinase